VRSFLLFLVITIVGSGSALAQDAVAVDPAHYKVEFENEQVRVLRITYGAQEESVMHSHPAGVAVFLDGANARFTSADGTTQDVELVEGQAIWAEATTHLPKNLSDDSFELILVELKTPAPAGE
jgi:quercetin dioxygenase-like cupin family protein